jgi:hypothetical protein
MNFTAAVGVKSSPSSLTATDEEFRFLQSGIFEAKIELVRKSIGTLERIVRRTHEDR